MTRDELGSYSTQPDGSAEGEVALSSETAGSDAPAAEQPRSRIGALVGTGLVIVALAAAGVWFYARAVAPVSAPSLVSLTPAAAEKLLAANGLGAGKASYQVTPSFPANLIIAQSPGPYASISRGALVNITIAVPPKPALVPDVVGAELAEAQSALDLALFKPMLTYAYSKDVPSGSVIEQLPRAGDTAMTGSADVVVISLGPGSPGKTVPAMIGRSLAQASRAANYTRLLVQARAVTATATADGIIVDQAPAAGTLVPVGTNVWVSIANSRASH